MRPKDVRYLTLREFNLAKFGKDRAEWANFKANAAMHGVEINDRKPIQAPSLTDDEIEARVKAIMEG